MFRHFVKIFFRNLKRYKLYSVINFASLVLGISFALLVYLFLGLGMTDDTFHENYEEVYQLESPTVHYTIDRWPRSLRDYAEENLPGAERIVSLHRLNTLVVRLEERESREDGLAASPGFFQMLSFDLERGSEETALEDPNAVYLTREKAQKIFGRANPLGENLEVFLQGEYRELFVAGIVDDYPANSSLKPELLLSTRLLDQAAGCPDAESSACNDQFYLQVLPENVEGVTAQAGGLLDSFNSELGLSGEDRLEAVTLGRPLRKMSHNHPVVYVIWLLGLLILGLSCINYVNNTIATTTTRFREIGIRKVMGSDRRGIALQFMAESLFSAFAALGLSLLFLELLMPWLDPYVRSLSGGTLSLSVDPLFRLEALPMLLGLALITGLMSGIWPALKLSGFKPISILKNRSAAGGSPALSRYLVGFQLVISLVVLVVVLHTTNTMWEMDREYYGYRTEGISDVAVTEPGEDGAYRSIFEDFRRELNREGLSLPVAGMRGGGTAGIEVDGREFSLRTREVTPSYFEMMEMSFSESSPRLGEPVAADSSLTVINRVLKEQVGWEGTVGRILDIGGRPHTVIGVLENFRGFEGGEQRRPYAFQLIPEPAATRALIETGGHAIPEERLRAEIQAIRESLQKKERPLAVSSYPYSRQERLLEAMVGWVAPISIFTLALAFLGLFSLTSFSVSRRLKEISIRKVNGAMPGELVRLLGKDYLVIGALAFVVALPLGYMASNFLFDFAVGTSASGSFFPLFGLSLISLLSFILLCVGYQVWSASNVNPVRYLKEE